MNRGRHKIHDEIKKQIKYIKKKHPFATNIKNINSLTIPILREMAIQQKIQTNKVDLELFFTKSINIDAESGGFTWSRTKQGWDFWYNVLHKYFIV